MDEKNANKLFESIKSKILESNKFDIAKQKMALKEKHTECLDKLTKMRKDTLKRENITDQKLSEIIDQFDGDLETDASIENKIAAEYTKEYMDTTGKYNFDKELEKEIGFMIDIESDEYTMTFRYANELYEVEYEGNEDEFRINLIHDVHDSIMTTLNEYDIWRSVHIPGNGQIIDAETNKVLSNDNGKTWIEEIPDKVITP